MTFVVRVSVDDAGRVSGIVERVQTGRKERFDSVESISRVIAGLLDHTSASTKPDRPEN